MIRRALRAWAAIFAVAFLAMTVLGAGVAVAAGGPAFLPLAPPSAEAGPDYGLESGLPPGFESGIAPVPPIPGGGTVLPGSGTRQPAQPAAPPESRERNLQRRGIVPAELRPGRPLLLSAPFPGVLASVPVRDGEAVSKGATVAVFDMEAAEKGVQEARLALAEAIAAVQEAGEASKEMKEMSERARERAEESLARRADALRDAEEKLARSTLAAPFDGRVTEVRAHAGQHLKRGDVVAELAETGDLEIVCIVPSQWINRLRPGHVIWVYVEERDKSYEAEFVRFGGKADPATRTIKTYSRFFTLPEDMAAEDAPLGTPLPGELLPGMSGRADFFPRRTR